MKVFLVGFMGSGKSSILKLLAQSLSFPFVDLDSFIEAKEDCTINDVFLKYGEDYFRSKESDVLKYLCSNCQDLVLSTGGGTPCYFNNMELMNANGITIYLKQNSDVLFHRLKKDKNNRPLLANLTEDEMLKFIQVKLKQREVFYHQSKIIVDCDGLSIEKMVEKIVFLLNNQP